MLADKDRKYILNEFLNNISGISDVEYQKRVWIRGEGPECDDFTETVCHFFDDGDPIINNYKNYGISDGQYHLLVNFRNNFEAFCDGPGLEYYLPQNFIDTPEWSKIMEEAKEVLVAFNYDKNKSTET